MRPVSNIAASSRYPDIAVTDVAVAASLGCTPAQIASQVAAKATGLRFSHRFNDWCASPLGEIAWTELGVQPGAPRDSDRLLRHGCLTLFDQLLSQSQLMRRYKAERIGLFVGTTTCGVSGFYPAASALLAAPNAFASVLTPSMQQAAIAHELAAHGHLKGPTYTLSSSCAASAQALGLAADAVAMDWVDAAIVVGADVLNLVTICGFASLQILDPQLCRPFTPEHAGINLGEAVVAALIERVPPDAPADRILGYAAVSEAYHMTQPAADGSGMHRCMSKALRRAEAVAEQISYINPHATGTVANDQAEAQALTALFGADAPIHATKGLTGHTLGACGLLETMIALQQLKAASARLGGKRVVGLSNSFGFGGANVSLILEGGTR